MNKQGKQKLTDTDNSTVVTRGRGGGLVKGTGVEGMSTDLTLGGGHTMQFADWYHRVVHLKPV